MQALYNTSLKGAPKANRKPFFFEQKANPQLQSRRTRRPRSPHQSHRRTPSQIPQRLPSTRKPASRSTRTRASKRRRSSQLPAAAAAVTHSPEDRPPSRTATQLPARQARDPEGEHTGVDVGHAGVHASAYAGAGVCEGGVCRCGWGCGQRWIWTRGEVSVGFWDI